MNPLYIAAINSYSRDIYSAQKESDSVFCAHLLRLANARYLVALFLYAPNDVETARSVLLAIENAQKIIELTIDELNEN